MGKLYYCEFCDKTFAGTQINIKNHRRGAKHKACKEEFFNRVRASTGNEKL